MWKWPRRKNKLAPFRKLCATFRCVMLSGLKQLLQSGQVRIEYNDYVRQQPGQPAPKAYRTLPPLVAMHQLLQHQTPAHFQRVRHYGLHSARRKIGHQLPQAVKKEGQTARTLIQILRALLGTEPFRCEQCGSTGFEVQPISSSRSYLHSQVLHRDRSPPFGLAGKTDHWINTSSRGGEPEPALSER